MCVWSNTVSLFWTPNHERNSSPPPVFFLIMKLRSLPVSEAEGICRHSLTICCDSINYAGDPHAPGSQIAATIWRQPQLLQTLFCICNSVTAAWNPVNARKSKWTLCFRLCLPCRVCGWVCVWLWRLTASQPVPQSGASLSASSWRLRGNADKDVFLCFILVSALEAAGSFRFPSF